MGFSRVKRAFRSKSKLPKPQYTDELAYAEDIRLINKKYGVSSTASVHEIHVSVPLPPLHQYQDAHGARPSSRRSLRAIVTNFSKPRPLSQQSFQPHIPSPPPYSSHPPPAPRSRHRERDESRPSPIAPEGYQRQNALPTEHVKTVHRKIAGAQGPGAIGGTNLPALQTMYFGGW